MLNKSIKLHSLLETTSTNSFLRDSIVADSNFRFEIAITKHQTAGRGQRDNKWESEYGKNLLFSILAYPSFIPVKCQFILSEAVSLSIIKSLKQTIESNLAKELTVKWPNDIYWKNKKLGGILIENDIQGYYLHRSIIGIGLNVNQSLFKSNAPNPVSLFNITGVVTDLDLLFEKITEQFLYYFSLLEQNNRDIIHNEYLQNLFRRENFYTYKDAKGEFMAMIDHVEPNGYLVLIDRHNTTRRYNFKEISFVL